MYTELVKIIEGGLKGDTKKVISYSKHLAKKLKEDGEIKLAEKILNVLNGAKSLPVYKDALFESPVDQGSRLNIADVVMPESIDLSFEISDAVKQPIENFISMVDSRNIIASKGLNLNLSLLLYGPPGCGKTSLAKYIAKELDMPIIIARFDSLISSLLGNTAKNIRQLFDYAKSKPCILFLDEFDAIAKARNDNNETGELKRVINSLLQNIDDYLDNGILIAATNHEKLLDKAIWRRFEKIIHVGKPTSLEVKELVTSYLKRINSNLSEDSKKIEVLTEYLNEYSHSEIIKIVNSAYYNSIIQKREFDFREIYTEYYKYKYNNSFRNEDLIKFLNDSNISQKQIADHLNISIRQVRNAFKD